MRRSQKNVFMYQGQRQRHRRPRQQQWRKEVHPSLEGHYRDYGKKLKFSIPYRRIDAHLITVLKLSL